MRRLIKSKRAIKENQNRDKTYRGKLAEDYDGIGQFVMVALSSSSVASAYKARVASGDFGTGQLIPKGTPVAIFVTRGKIEILSLGAK